MQDTTLAHILEMAIASDDYIDLLDADNQDVENILQNRVGNTIHLTQGTTSRVPRTYEIRVTVKRLT